MIYLSRRVSFSSAHRYYQSEFTEAQNKKIFGRCYTEYGHGHNFILEVTLTGKVDSKTGMIINLVDVDQILKEVTDPMDHHHLNFDHPAFKRTVPTTENIARFCFIEVKKRLPKNVRIVRARIYEAENLWADCFGE